MRCVRGCVSARCPGEGFSSPGCPEVHQTSNKTIWPRIINLGHRTRNTFAISACTAYLSFL
eukprot:3636672-Heterocapsa_arctica.AAC.1